MRAQKYRQFRVLLSHDAETSQTVAEVPALGIGDYGGDADEALRNVRDMIVFHLECLLEEGAAIPEETATEEGLYLRVSMPVRAA